MKIREHRTERVPRRSADAERTSDPFCLRGLRWIKCGQIGSNAYNVSDFSAEQRLCDPPGIRVRRRTAETPQTYVTYFTLTASTYGDRVRRSASEHRRVFDRVRLAELVEHHERNASKDD